MLVTETTGVHYIGTGGPACPVQPSSPAPPTGLLFTVLHTACLFPALLCHSLVLWLACFPLSSVAAEPLIKCHLFYEILSFRWCCFILRDPKTLCCTYVCDSIFFIVLELYIPFPSLWVSWGLLHLCIPNDGHSPGDYIFIPYIYRAGMIVSFGLIL